MSRIKELQEFPAIFTFKITGDNSPVFIGGVTKIFDIPDREVKITEKFSASSKYISFSVTTIVLEYEELEDFYKKISVLEGIRFYV